MAMKAVVYASYGAPDVLEVKEVDKPAPRDDEVLVRVRATTVSAADHRARSLDFPRGFALFGRLVTGIWKPRRPILGTELAGEIEAVGDRVTKFKPGDQVLAFPGLRFGAHAEYRCMPENGAIALKPSNLTYEEAAALPFGGTTALHFLKRGKIRRGERVLINGASGAVGVAAVQLAKYFGAHVTGVCSTANCDLVKSLGADAVVDYTVEDFTQNGETYDVIVDCVGTAPLSRSRRSLEKGGRLLLVVATLPEMLAGAWASMTSSRKVIAGGVTATGEDLRFLVERTQSGELRAVIDRRYPFDRMADAHAYVDGGHKKGAVIITLF
jgi:NADPH:quinone reductase-like Zn-dependent oxidoreductase